MNQIVISAGVSPADLSFYYTQVYCQTSYTVKPKTLERVTFVLFCCGSTVLFVCTVRVHA